MKQLIVDFGKQLQTALAIAKASKLSAAPNPIHNVVVAGMGGSGIGGNLVQSWCAASMAVPITVSKSYEAPGFINQNTLFVACSFSGGTEETLAALEQAFAKGAKIVCVTSGGKMGEYAAAHNLDVVNIPGESGSPRASIGYSFVQLMNIFNFYGLNPSNHFADFEATIALLESEQVEINEKAKELAKAMKGKLPIFYADSKFEGVVLRTQQQIAENSKQMSHSNVFPEMNHNELVGWQFAEGIWNDVVTVVLRSYSDHPRTAARMNISIDIFKKVQPAVIELPAKGDTLIVQSLYFIHLLDWVSFYLAEENNVDPFPVDAITLLKNELAKIN